MHLRKRRIVFNASPSSGKVFLSQESGAVGGQSRLSDSKRMSGRQERVLFADSAVAIIHHASQGLPRVVNHLCRQALYEITGTQRQVVEEGNKRDCKK